MSLPRRQFTTFQVGGELYGIDVMQVQEVTGCPSVTAIPLAPEYVVGNVNLRGQISVALALRSVFGSPAPESKDCMSVVCRMEGELVSLLVDSVGDVVEVESAQFEAVPDTLPETAREVLSGVYKLEGSLLSVIDLPRLHETLARWRAPEASRQEPGNKEPKGTRRDG